MQNATAYGKGIIAGTYSQAYLAVSTNHCLTFTDYTIFNGAALGANTVQFGDIFNDLTIDPAGNLYAVAAGFIMIPFATKSDVFLFTSPAASAWLGVEHAQAGEQRRRSPHAARSDRRSERR